MNSCYGQEYFKAKAFFSALSLHMKPHSNRFTFKHTDTGIVNLKIDLLLLYLFQAAYFGKVGCLEHLLQAKANTDVQDNKGETALMKVYVALERY